MIFKKNRELSSDISNRRSINPDLATTIVFVLTATLATIIIWRLELDLIQIRRAQLSHLADDHAHIIQINIERAFSATFSMAALVRQGNGTIQDFDATASEMLQFYPGVASLQLAPGGIVRNIVPLAGNESAIGHNLLKDPARTREAFLARETGKLTMAGPFPLLQGGVGAVGRLPVFLEKSSGSSSFWGFVIVLILFPDVLDPAHLSGLEEQGMQYELWCIHPDTGKKQIIVSSSSVLPVEHIDSSLKLPNETWTLSVAPSGGCYDPVGFVFKVALGISFSLLLSLLARTMVNTRAEALRIAKDLMSDLQTSEQKFRAIFEQTFQFIGLLSVDGTLLEVNRSALEFCGVKASEVIGRPFGETPWWRLSQEMQKKLSKAVKSAAQGEFVRFEATHPAIDGIIHYIDFSLKPVVDKDGNVVLIIPEGRDITDLRQVEEELRKLNQELEQRVHERTVQLVDKNIELKMEIHERKQVEEELRKAKAALEESNLMLETLSITDSLTGLANRRRFDEALNKEVARHLRSGAELSMILLDIDHFKLFNDSYGHVEGDSSLQQIARVITKNVVRSADTAARYGGEEFACILPETDLNGAIAIAEKIRSGIENLAIPHDSSTTAGCVTASLGVITITCDDRVSASQVTVMADKLLYRAKEGGRNRVEAESYNQRRPQSNKMLENSLVQLIWQDSFCSGNLLIDAQHQGLFRASNQLLDAILSALPKSEILAIATHLLEDIAQHFHDEEAILESVKFPGLQQHREEHTRLYKKSLKLAQELYADTTSLGDTFNFLVHEVVFQHMYLTDQEFFPFVGNQLTP